jgi:membrane associated rhomboid family serine protease
MPPLGAESTAIRHTPIDVFGEGSRAVSISGGSLKPVQTRGDQLKAHGAAALVDLRLAAEITVFVIALIWLVQGINALDAYKLDSQLGIVARSPSSLPHILTAPFLHVNLDHIESNTPPLALLTFLAVLGGVKRFLFAVATIVVVGGLGTWLFSPSGSYTVGASGLIFGLLGYVAVRGLFARQLWQKVWQLAVGITVFIYYQWTLVLLYPSATVTAMHISWQGHLCGLLAGILAAILLWRRGKRLEAAPEPLPIV